MIFFEKFVYVHEELEQKICGCQVKIKNISCKFIKIKQKTERQLF
jgi:hypothetical protein